ncbi:MAG: vgr related protein [Sphingomicrobium sp.]
MPAAPTYVSCMSAERPLTEDEVALARSIFGDAIDYAKVRMIRRKWWPLQPKNAAMAPTGNIHFHPHGNLWSDDFGAEPLHLQGLFIHELTHVWQTRQRGTFYLPLMRHPFCRYAYELVPGKPFDWYGLEQQAEIVRHVFMLRRGYALKQAAVQNELERLLAFSA